MLAATGGFVLGIFYLLEYLLSDIAVPGFASTIIVVLILGGVQLLSLGVMGEYLGRLLMNVNRKPQYSVRRIVTQDTNEESATSVSIIRRLSADESNKPGADTRERVDSVR